MAVENDKAIKVIEEFYDPKLAGKIVSAFDAKRDIQYPHSVWDCVVEVLRFNQPYTLGLSGKIGVAWNDTTCDFPNVILTNRLTNLNIYVVDNNVQYDLNVIAFGSNSSLYSGLGSVLEVKKLGERSIFWGMNIRYGKNKKLSSFNEELDCERKLSLNGDIEHGFILSHDNGELCSIDDVSKLVGSC